MIIIYISLLNKIVLTVLLIVTVYFIIKAILKDVEN